MYKNHQHKIFRKLVKRFYKSFDDRNMVIERKQAKFLKLWIELGQNYELKNDITNDPKIIFSRIITNPILDKYKHNFNVIKLCEKAMKAFEAYTNQAEKNSLIADTKKITKNALYKKNILEDRIFYKILQLSRILKRYFIDDHDYILRKIFEDNFRIFKHIFDKAFFDMLKDSFYPDLQYSRKKDLTPSPTHSNKIKSVRFAENIMVNFFLILNSADYINRETSDDAKKLINKKASSKHVAIISTKIKNSTDQLSSKIIFDEIEKMKESVRQLISENSRYSERFILEGDSYLLTNTQQEKKDSKKPKQKIIEERANFFQNIVDREECKRAIGFSASKPFSGFVNVGSRMAKHSERLKTRSLNNHIQDKITTDKFPSITGSAIYHIEKNMVKKNLLTLIMEAENRINRKFEQKFIDKNFVTMIESSKQLAHMNLCEH